MKVFVTGGSGWIGSAVVPELLGAGHEVLGLARSDEAAAALNAAGAQVFRGSIDDPDGLRAGVALSDGVVHLAYNHDFAHMDDAAKTDRGVLEAVGAELQGTNRPFVVAGGVIGLVAGREATERDVPVANYHPRVPNVAYALSLAEHAVRSACVRFAPTVHGEGDHGFIATLVGIARDKGVSGYIDDGVNRWPAVHRYDAARLVRLTLEGAPAGTSVHAVAESGIATRAIAEAIAVGLGLPTVSIPRSRAADHFGWMALFFGADTRASNAYTRELLDWNPTHPRLLDDLAKDYYFRESSA